MNVDISNIAHQLVEMSGFIGLFEHWESAAMLVLACVLSYLAIVRKFEPLLLLGIAFGMMLANLPNSGLMHPELFRGDADHIDYLAVLHYGGLLDLLYLGVKLGIYPCLIFMGVGAMTDFSPMIARPSSMLLGAATQFGIYTAFLLAIAFNFNPSEAASIGIIGSADGPTTIFLTTKLAPHLLGPIAIAAYSYMALIPMIQPPIMTALTTHKERATIMRQERTVSKTTKIIFPIAVTLLIGLTLPLVAPLIGCLMLGNLFRECGVVDRLSDTAQNALMNIVTIFLSITVGATSIGYVAGPDGANIGFLSMNTIKIIVLGLFSFAISTAAGVLFGRIMYRFSGGKINPLIGSAGVSALPMAARVCQMVGQKANPQNHLLMHAMGPNVTGIIGSAVVAGCFLAVLG